MAILTRADKGTPLTHNEMDNNLIELDTIPNGKVFPKTKGVGVKIDTDAPDYGWHDIIGEIFIIDTAPNPAVIAPFIGTLYEPSFAEDECAYIKFHIPHDYAPNTDFYIHVHWAHNSAVVTGGSVTWGVEMSYSKGHNQGAFTTPINVSITQNASTTQYQHLVAETVASAATSSGTTIDRSLIEPDGIILCKICLINNAITTSDLSVAKPFAFTADIHYQSTGVATKNKEPDFWT